MDDTVIDVKGANTSLWREALRTLIARHGEQPAVWFYWDAVEALKTLSGEGIAGILGHHEWPWTVHLALCAWEELPAGISHADVVAQIDWLEAHLPSCL
jgi:hypothetical protein